jgi:hypothetical protein
MEERVSTSEELRRLCVSSTRYVQELPSSKIWGEIESPADELLEDEERSQLVNRRGRRIPKTSREDRIEKESPFVIWRKR